MSEFDTEYTGQAICPYCGYAERDSWEIGEGQEGDTDHDCGKCGATYDVCVSVDISYTTRKQTEKP